MAKMSLREYANKWLKEKGKSTSEAKKDAGKYKSIAAAKKAGSLYYTNKDGKTMLAVYAEDLKDKGPLRPKLRPGSEKKTGTPTKRLDTKGDTPAKKKAMPVEDLTFTVTAAVDGKSGVQAYINKLEKQLTELRAEVAAGKKRGISPRKAEAEIRRIEGSIKRIKQKQGMSKGGMVDMRTTGLFR